MNEPLVRPAVPDDAEAIAVVHHNLLGADVLRFPPGRALGERHRRATRAAVARATLRRRSGEPLGRRRRRTGGGLRQGWPTRRKRSVPAPVRSEELWALYVLGERHGTGVGALLLETVLPPARPAELWVADANPRARRFYEKHGFTPDGARFTDDLNFALVRMVR